jgi:hypothetical protein
MVRFYFYPIIDPGKDFSSNPYCKNFLEHLSRKAIIVNKDINKYGVLDFFRYLTNCDAYILNWIVDLPKKKFGKLQVIAFSVFLTAAKILKRKIIWFLHDKYSHDTPQNLWTDYLFNLTIKSSDLIITHSKEGLQLINDFNPKYLVKTRYLIHPVKIISSSSIQREIKYDFLIWGAIFPYKGILEFIKFVKETPEMHLYKILILGKCIDRSYESELEKNMTTNITYLNKHFSFNKIADSSQESRFTLFTYKPESVLSSGTLMDSIGMGSIIIGPNYGAFKDLGCYSFMNIYDSFYDIIAIYNNYHDNALIKQEITNFCIDNSWDSFIEKLCREFSSL